MTARYTYDAWNRRTSKTAGGRTIHYHYDQDSRLIGESLANGTVLREYVYLRGEPVALLEYETRPGWYFYVTDHLGTPQQLVDSRGAVVWQAAYLPYGEAKVLKATVQNNLRFPGQYFDAETGLHYNWNRYYNPKTGRYITADPIGLAGGMNVYAYVGGNPVNAVDVEGLITEVIITGGTWYGHAAVSINGRVYSSGRYNPASAHSFKLKGDNIMIVQNHSTYIEGYKRKGRNSTGYIFDISSDDERKIELYFKTLIKSGNRTKFGYKLQDDYSFLFENCATTSSNALQEGLSWFSAMWIYSNSPYDLEFNLITSPWLVRNVVHYPGEKE
ncbi:hypothetical protein AXF15_00470 [Desulfomicrobium orale DSM 12838]|uniref:RHS protein conserved region domain-containing protein n=1 Tax=Desulfomicrobium orale DSM 12838 TaxID=888061 RepID=A0A0X8JN13_9BACT|nr:hypothetical protein AXF15_00470 [Desulfomicrobium orale DSM 12838]